MSETSSTVLVPIVPISAASSTCLTGVFETIGRNILRMVSLVPSIFSLAIWTAVKGSPIIARLTVSPVDVLTLSICDGAGTSVNSGNSDSNSTSPLNTFLDDSSFANIWGSRIRIAPGIAPSPATSPNALDVLNRVCNCGAKN